MPAVLYNECSCCGTAYPVNEDHCPQCDCHPVQETNYYETANDGPIAMSGKGQE
jgi:hypothetical protein